jgi:tetratricopeptide (TPR) repeat protein
MRAFIVRPFGPRSGIDFNLVQRDLIDPALARARIAGDTTQQFVEAGNIRVDMFEQLLLADLVIADISVHNANVFYELGIRHALRARQTILIRAKVSKPRADRTAEDDVPFDLRTDRYLEYDHTNPSECLDELSDAIAATRDGTRTDSPVFLSLPGLAEHDRARFAPLPPGFAEEVAEAAAKKDVAHLSMLAGEAATFTWALEGCKAVGDALFDIRAWEPARRALESVRAAYPNDPHANLRLATVYQRLGDLTRSDQAIDRVLANTAASGYERSESLALRGSNEKARWTEGWTSSMSLDATALRREALLSPFLERAIDSYHRAFLLNLNNYYPGLVALSLLTIRKELIDQLPDAWKDEFDSDDKADAARGEIDASLSALSGAVRLSLDADATSAWAAMSRADYQFLVARRPSAAVAAYRKALGAQRLFHSDAARKQLQIFKDLGLKTDRVNDCLAMFADPAPPQPRIEHVVIFTGHRLDEPGRTPPRLPRACLDAAAAEIRGYLEELKPTIAIAAAASGGDMLFHEVCDQLGLRSVVRLVMPEGLFANQSVADAGADWVDRFWVLINAKRAKGDLAILSQDSDLPVWLRRRPGYSVFRRANLWMLEEALAMDPQRLTVLALWDGTEGGAGGTGEFVAHAETMGATLMRIDPADICG